ncbi:MAG: PQQ-dependent sugar dehydrogenase [Chitinophagaceae bacterium]
MKHKILFPVIVFAICAALFSCKSGNAPDANTITTDSLTIAAGQTAFTAKCSGCHNFRQDGIGTNLSGITKEVSVDWLQHFINDPKKLIESGDERAKKLFNQFHTTMPSFASANNDEINSIIAFLNTHQQRGAVKKFDSTALTNPIPTPIALSGLVVDLKLITQIPASSDSGKKPLARITKMDYHDRIGPFILDLRGKLYKLNGDKASVYMDMKRLMPKFINEPGLATGFGSFAFHPDFLKNGLIYTTHSEPAGSGKADFGFADSIKPALQWVLTEWKTDRPTADTFIGKSRELLRIEMVSVIHGVQEIIFNPLSRKGDADYGLLYIGIGDGGAVENGYPSLAHSRDKPWGSVLRVDPAGRNSRNGQYGVPASNPFAKSNGSLGEIYAYGFRNPHRITWTKDGKMLVSNVGHSNIESINLIEAGYDYGWPIREGSFLLDASVDITKVHTLPGNDSQYHVTYPVVEYDHDEGKAISGGYEYSGTDVAALKGKFLFGDIPSGRLFFVNTNDLKQGSQAQIKEWKVSVDGNIKKLSELCGSDRVDLHFGRDDHGEMYILTKADGKIYKMANASEKR